MPQLRKDPIIGRWVIIATERAKRPVDFAAVEEAERLPGPCPFCQGNESLTPPEITAVREPHTEPNRPGWKVRVVPSISPVLGIEGALDRRGVGMYDAMRGVGAHEIIVETPEHIANTASLSAEQVELLIATYADRIQDLQKDVRFKYVLVFKNYGWTAGGSRINHARSQLIATPVNPKRVKEELAGAKRYFDYKERCIFCDMIKQELKDRSRIVIEQDGFVALAPFASRFPFEIWILPTEHSCDFYKIGREQVLALAKVLKAALFKLSMALKDPPYNYILHSAPFRTKVRTSYWKSIDQDFHWHIEVMPRLTKVAGFEWGTGFYINPMPPETAAKYLRDVKV